MLVDERGLAEGVQYFDRKTGKEQRVYGKVVIMGASAVDTTRILLNSKSDKHPNGIGNGSDVIGRYLCEQIRVHVRGFLPQLFGQPAQQRPRHRRRAHLHAALHAPAEEPRVHPRVPDAVLEHRIAADEPAAHGEARSPASAPTSSGT